MSHLSRLHDAGMRLLQQLYNLHIAMAGMHVYMLPNIVCMQVLWKHSFFFAPRAGWTSKLQCPLPSSPQGTCNTAQARNTQHCSWYGAMQAVLAAWSCMTTGGNQLLGKSACRVHIGRSTDRIRRTCLCDACRLIRRLIAAKRCTCLLKQSMLRRWQMAGTAWQSL